MPTITYKGNGRSFSITGGCLAVMGRTRCAAENIKETLLMKGIDKVSTVRFKDILHLDGNVGTNNLKYRDVFTKYMSMFPFMRCVKTPYDKILTTTDCTFDAENYTQNEIMHAMFHIRQLAYPTLNAFEGNTYMIKSLYKLTEQGVPFWKAYTLCMIPTHINPRFPVENFNRFLEADANTFMLKSLPLTKFKKLISGKKPKPKYKGGTILKNAMAEKPYAQNMTEYLSGCTPLTEPTVYDLIHKVIEDVQLGKEGRRITDAFGHPIGMRQSRYPVTDNDLLASLDKALHLFGITGKGKIC